MPLPRPTSQAQQTMNSKPANTEPGGFRSTRTLAAALNAKTGEKSESLRTSPASFGGTPILGTGLESLDLRVLGIHILVHGGGVPREEQTAVPEF